MIFVSLRMNNLCVRYITKQKRAPPTTSLIGRVRKNSGGKRQACYQPQVTTGKRRSLSPLVPLSLTTQVPDQ